MDDDFAIGGESEPEAKGLVKSDEVLIEIHLEFGIIRHSENPKIEASAIRAKKAMLAVTVVDVGIEEEARRGAEG